MTSRRALDYVERLVRPAKAGHAGTLDPLASGVLVVCVGQATRLIEYVQQMPKRYVGEFLLGRESPTEDLEGEVTELINPPIPRQADIERACLAFTGSIEQRPPDFSALKIAGQPAYKMARAGKTVELAARTVTVHELKVLAYDYPQVTLEILCSAGTYVRSLGRDLAESLGTAAVMSNLVRIAIGDFTLAAAVDPTRLSAANWRDYLLPAKRAVPSLPQVTLSPPDQDRIAAGLLLACSETSAPQVAAVDETGELIAILEARPGGLYCPFRNFRGRG